MSELFRRILDLLEKWVSYLLPFAVLREDHCGLILRFGQYRRDLTPGWNWKWPIVECDMSEVAALDSTVLREQTLTSKDGRKVTLRGVLAYRVIDPRKYILECATAESVVNDVGCGVVAEIVPRFEAEEILSSDDLCKKLLTRMRVRAKHWGVQVESFGLVDRVESETYRIVTGPLGGSTERPE